MEKFKVLLDSTSDLDKNIRKKYNISYLHMTFCMDNKQYDADLDWNTISPSVYYNNIRNGKRITTSIIKTQNLTETFEKYLKNGMDILYISCSSKLSGSLNYARIIALDYKDKYKNNKVICFDSLRSNCSQGLMGIDASIMAKEGKSIDEVVNYLIENRLKYQTFATVSSLVWLKKAGRIKPHQALYDDLFNLKPIIMTDYDGTNSILDKVQGRNESLDYLINIVLKRIEDKTNHTVFIEHADCYSEAIYIKNKLITKNSNLEIRICNLGPIIGAATGPDTITISFYGKKIIKK